MTSEVTSVDEAVRKARRYRESLTARTARVTPRGVCSWAVSGNYIEELLSMIVDMPLLGFSGRHKLLDHQEVRIAAEDPAIAGVAPVVVVA